MQRRGSEFKFHLTYSLEMMDITWVYTELFLGQVLYYDKNSYVIANFNLSIFLPNRKNALSRSFMMLQQLVSCIELHEKFSSILYLNCYLYGGTSESFCRNKVTKCCKKYIFATTERIVDFFDLTQPTQFTCIREMSCVTVVVAQKKETIIGNHLNNGERGGEGNICRRTLPEPLFSEFLSTATVQTDNLLMYIEKC